MTLAAEAKPMAWMMRPGRRIGRSSRIAVSQAESRSHFIYTYMYPRFTERWCNAVMFYSSLIDEGGKAPQ